MWYRSHPWLIVICPTKRAIDIFQLPHHFFKSVPIRSAMWHKRVRHFPQNPKMKSAGYIHGWCEVGSYLLASCSTLLRLPRWVEAACRIACLMQVATFSETVSLGRMKYSNWLRYSVTSGIKHQMRAHGKLMSIDLSRFRIQLSMSVAKISTAISNTETDSSDIWLEDVLL